MAGRSCPSCGIEIPSSLSRCPNCRQTVISMAPPPGPVKSTEPPRVRSAAPLSLPRFVPDARYCFGKTWTSGCLWVVTEGIFFLSESDGYLTPDSCGGLTPLPDVAKIGTQGFFAPMEHIEKINHKTPINACVTISAKKVPVRLNTEGWIVLDSYAALTGIPLE